VQIYLPGAGDSAVPPDEPLDEEEVATEYVQPQDRDFAEAATREGRETYVVDNVPVHVVSERVQYLDADGKLVTESLKDYTRKAVSKEYTSLDQFLQTWTDIGKKKIIIEELEKHGVFFDALAEEVGKDYDPFDLVCHVAFDQSPLTRKERAENVRKRNYFTKYGDQARLVLEALLDKYSDEGIENIEELTVLKVPPISHLGTPIEIVKLFGGKEQYLAAISELEQELYKVA
jgi:type I restriction enzyme R subunit